jgi:hypothetical protein
MDDKQKVALGVVITQQERDVIRALAFIEGKTISDTVYPWIRSYLLAAAQRPDVQAVVAQKQQVPVELAEKA